MIDLLSHIQHKKTVIFDYNGTILYDTELCVESLNRLLATHELNPMTELEYRRKFNFPIAHFYRDLGLDFNKESFDSLGRRYFDHYLQNFHRCAIYKGFRELLRELHERQIKTAILTALNHDLLHDQLERFGLTSLFDAAYGLPDHSAHSKIARGIELMNHLNSRPEDTIVVGDTVHDHEVAKALGTEVVLLGDGHQDEGRLTETQAKVLYLNRQPDF